MFKELYYWMYMTLRKIKTNDTPAFNSYIFICLLQGFNIGTIYVIATYILKISTTADRKSAIYMGLGLAAVLFITNYFLLYAQRESIFEKYKEKSPERKINGQVFFWMYFLLSTIIFFVAAANLVTPKY